MLVSQKRRELVTNLITSKGDDMDQQSVSQILYGNPSPTQKNLIGVRSLKQTIEIPSKLPAIIQEKMHADRYDALKSFNPSGPIKAQELSVASLPKTSKSNKSKGFF